jgi:transposase
MREPFLQGNMLSAFKYRIYPNAQQEMRLKRSPLSLCNLYDRLRARKIQEYRENGVSLTRTDLRAIALKERRSNSELQSIYSQVVQNITAGRRKAVSSFHDVTHPRGTRTMPWNL